MILLISPRSLWNQRKKGTKLKKKTDHFEIRTLKLANKPPELSTSKGQIKSERIYEIINFPKI